jgi:hypothetical protein
LFVPLRRSAAIGGKKKKLLPSDPKERKRRQRTTESKRCAAYNKSDGYLVFANLAGRLWLGLAHIMALALPISALHPWERVSFVGLNLFFFCDSYKVEFIVASLKT